jgi:hypothetical protein
MISVTLQKLNLMCLGKQELQDLSFSQQWLKVAAYESTDMTSQETEIVRKHINEFCNIVICFCALTFLHW